jgi:hypothetical protein
LVVLLPEVKQLGHKADHLIPHSVEVKNEAAILLPHLPSCNGQEQLYLYMSLYIHGYTKCGTEYYSINLLTLWTFGIDQSQKVTVTPLKLQPVPSKWQ